MNNITIDENTSKQLHKLLQDLATFIALYEQSDDRLKINKEQMDHQLVAYKNEVQLQMQKIQEVINELKDVMSVAGAARWRIAAEKSMSEGEEHLKAMREVCDNYKKLTEGSITRLEQTALMTEKRLAKTLQHLSDDNTSVVEVFQNRSENTYQRLDLQTKSVIDHLRRLLRWLRWDRFLIAIFTALFASLLTSVYINAEWPWDSHSQAQQERYIGRTLLRVWPQLSKDKQMEINKILGTHVN